MNEEYVSRAEMAQTCMVMARVFAKLRSKDPNTQVGACVYDTNTGGLFLGYNGFNHDTPNFKGLWNARSKETAFEVPYIQTSILGGAPLSLTKYDAVVHAETNAVRKAMSALGRLDTCVMYVSHYPCRVCMRDSVIPSGIKSVFIADDKHFDPISQWLAGQNSVRITKLFDNVEALDAFIKATT
jgi:dCMP deaminase